MLTTIDCDIITKILKQIILTSLSLKDLFGRKVSIYLPLDKQDSHSLIKLLGNSSQLDIVETVSMLHNELLDNIDFVSLEGPRRPIHSACIVKMLGHRCGRISLSSHRPCLVMFGQFPQISSPVDVHITNIIAILHLCLLFCRIHRYFLHTDPISTRSDESASLTHHIVSTAFCFLSSSVSVCIRKS